MIYLCLLIAQICAEVSQGPQQVIMMLHYLHKKTRVWWEAVSFSMYDLLIL